MGRWSVGYGRLEGVAAGEALSRLYSASRLFVNFFQPSFKLASKERIGSHVRKRYHAPETPCARLLASSSIAVSSSHGHAPHCSTTDRFWRMIESTMFTTGCQQRVQTYATGFHEKAGRCQGEVVRSITFSFSPRPWLSSSRQRHV